MKERKWKKIIYAPRLLSYRLESSFDTIFGYIVDVVTIDEKITKYKNNKPIKHAYSVKFKDREFSRYNYETYFKADKCAKIVYTEDDMFSNYEDCKILVDKLNQTLYAEYEADPYTTEEDIKEYKRIIDFEQKLAQNNWAEEIKSKTQKIK